MSDNQPGPDLRPTEGGKILRREGNEAFVQSRAVGNKLLQVSVKLLPCEVPDRDHQEANSTYQQYEVQLSTTENLKIKNETLLKQ